MDKIKFRFLLAQRMNDQKKLHCRPPFLEKTLGLGATPLLEGLDRQPPQIISLAPSQRSLGKTEINVRVQSQEALDVIQSLVSTSLQKKKKSET